MADKTNNMYRIAVSETLGRHYVAKRLIRSGEQVLLERPLVVGPHTRSLPVCLNCCKEVPPLPFAKVCTRCKVAPLCTTCSAVNTADVDKALDQPDTGGIIKHDLRECDLYLNSQLNQSIIMQNMQIVAPLRCLLLRGEEYDRMLDLEPHMHQRRNTSIWKAHQSGVVDLLHELNLVDQEAVASELLQKICGILDVNSFELRTAKGDSSASRGLYPKAAFLAHDCRANVHVTLDSTNMMRVYASQDIPEKSTLYFNYTSPLYPTWLRREHLSRGKYFDCYCERCRDPTEFGTFLGSMKCLTCHIGQVVPENPLAPCPWSCKNLWRCNHCEATLVAPMVKEVLDRIIMYIEQTDKTDENCLKSTLNTITTTVTPGHYLVIDLKQTFAGVLRDLIAREANPPKRLLQKKLDICRDLVEVLTIVEPGISRLTGIALYETHSCVALLAHREFGSHDITAGEFLERLQEAESLLKRAISLLLYEPKDTPEGILTKRAFDDLRALRDSLSEAKEMAQIDVRPKSCKKVVKPHND